MYSHRLYQWFCIQFQVCTLVLHCSLIHLHSNLYPNHHHHHILDTLIHSFFRHMSTEITFNQVFRVQIECCCNRRTKTLVNRWKSSGSLRYEHINFTSLPCESNCIVIIYGHLQVSVTTVHSICPWSQALQGQHLIATENTYSHLYSFLHVYIET